MEWRISPWRGRAETPRCCFGMNRRGKRCPKDRQKSSLLIPISSGLSELDGFGAVKAIPRSCPYSQLLDRYTKGQGRRASHGTCCCRTRFARHRSRSWETKGAAHQSLDGRSDYDSPTRTEPSIAQASLNFARNRVDASAHNTPPAAGYVQHRLLVDRYGLWPMP